MVESLYSEFDSDIVIRSAHGKTFDEKQINFNQLARIEGIKNHTKAVEEIVVLKHEKKWVNAHMVGVEHTFLKMSNTAHHIVDGDAYFTINQQPSCIIGATLLDNLGGYIPTQMGYETLIMYVPKRNAKMRLGATPFNTETIRVAGRMNYNKEVNAETILVPIQQASALLNYDQDITAVYIDVQEGISNDDVKLRLKSLLGADFEVKTNYEKNELIYKTSKSEKLIVLFILLFIFILAAFNLVASLTMLFIEKMENIHTMISFGANKKFIFNIFFYEGLLIAGKGIIYGLVIGYAICLLQVYGHVIVMPNQANEAFPMEISWVDSIIIISLVSTLSCLASYLPVRYLIKKNFEKVKF